MRFSIIIGLVTSLLAALAFGLTLRDAVAVYGPLEVYGGIARSAFYFGLAAGGCTYAIRCGGAPERLIGIIILSGVVADPLLHQFLQVRFARVDPTHLLIDSVSFIAFLAVSLRAHRFWPLWLSAFQLLSLGAHGAKAMNLSIHPVVYSAMTVAWSYGMLFLLIGATRYHQRLRARGEMRKSWSDFSRRPGRWRGVSPNA